MIPQLLRTIPLKSYNRDLKADSRDIKSEERLGLLIVAVLQAIDVSVNVLSLS